MLSKVSSICLGWWWKVGFITQPTEKGGTITDSPGKVLASPIILKQEMLRVVLQPITSDLPLRGGGGGGSGGWHPFPPDPDLAAHLVNRCHLWKAGCRGRLGGQESPREGWVGFSQAKKAWLQGSFSPTPRWAGQPGTFSSSSLLSDTELLLTANLLHKSVYWSIMFTKHYTELIDPESCWVNI